MNSFVPPPPLFEVVLVSCSALSVDRGVSPRESFSSSPFLRGYAVSCRLGNSSMSRPLRAPYADFLSFFYLHVLLLEKLCLLPYSVQAGPTVRPSHWFWFVGTRFGRGRLSWFPSVTAFKMSPVLPQSNWVSELVVRFFWRLA